VTPGRLELAKTLGATHVINSRETDPVAAIREITGGGADYTLECSGRTAVLRQAIDALGTLGACGIVGATKEGTEVAFNVNDVTISTSGMTVYDEETFGPVTTVVRVNGVEEAVRVANDTVYGLSAAVFGRDVTRALAVASRIESGSVHINGATVQNEPQASYGGMKQSGYGRFDGRAVIDQFTEVKWVTIEPSNQTYPF
jgi:acyl-CoA reductase-like NAD-dependent aldehyde dehydrogenase